MTIEQSLLLLTWVAIAILALAMLGLVRQVANLANNASGNLPFQQATEFGLPTELAAIRGELPKSFVVVCVTNTCAACSERLNDLARMTEPPIVVVSSAHLDPVQGVPDTVLRHVVTEQEFEAFGVFVTPLAAVVSGDEVVETLPLGSTESLATAIALTSQEAGAPT